MEQKRSSLHYIIIAHLRRIGYRNIYRNEAFTAARVARGQYRCAKCLSLFKREEMHGDHISPVIEPSTGFVDWNRYIERLFYGPIQVLCKTCHKAKTKEENSRRWEIVK